MESPRTKSSSKASVKSPARENTKPQDFKLHTHERAIKRALFNYTVATKLYLIEQQKKQIERLQEIMKEEEIRMLRKEMIPRAQLMPFFDRPFFPQRSNRPLTVPKEPNFKISMSSRSSSCISYECCVIWCYSHYKKRLRYRRIFTDGKIRFNIPTEERQN